MPDGGRPAGNVTQALRAELEKNPALGRQARSATGGMKLCTTRIEGTDSRPPLTVTYVYDAPPPEPGIVRIALVTPALFS
ncbi:hypothetical protein IAG44_24210 [Streptomyces roseirectus]|uniref:Uncharacterized protein n=1 Tax=Streptomyces roseirectus TaxID=2768066 RepID=A0A7H0IHE4_9ACTN|nr:hypothetical protein [Streptomyces roseirectus]QNP72210.1 hypothetical protein IAG44_24210 [Streptomyces roseirectus]